MTKLYNPDLSDAPSIAPSGWRNQMNKWGLQGKTLATDVQILDSS